MFFVQVVLIQKTIVVKFNHSCKSVCYLTSGAIIQWYLIYDLLDHSILDNFYRSLLYLRRPLYSVLHHISAKFFLSSFPIKIQKLLKFFGGSGFICGGDNNLPSFLV